MDRPTKHASTERHTDRPTDPPLGCPRIDGAEAIARVRAAAAAVLPRGTAGWVGQSVNILKGLQTQVIRSLILDYLVNWQLMATEEWND